MAGPVIAEEHDGILSAGTRLCVQRAGSYEFATPFHPWTLATPQVLPAANLIPDPPCKVPGEGGLAPAAAVTVRKRFGSAPLPTHPSNLFNASIAFRARSVPPSCWIHSGGGESNIS